MSFGAERVGDTIVQDLPNLKIEIENDLTQKMDTDDEGSVAEKAPTETVSSETEEGELVDDDDRLGQQSLGKLNAVDIINSQIAPVGRSILKYDTKEYVELQEINSVKNPNGAFVTGVNIFSPEEQAKLDKRAQRFGIEATEGKVLTEKLLKKLYKSMCVKPTDKNIRAEALHMRGTEQMTTQEVFGYFKDYGPASLEWITDNSCNVVWLDEVSAARALLGLSVHISGQPPPDTPQRRHSLSDSDVEMEAIQAKPIEETVEAADNNDNLSEESDAVALDELEVKLPPGRWRRGAPHPLSQCILLRFATTCDRSLPRPGVAKYGNHHFGGYVGLISESRKRRMQPAPIPFEDIGDEALPKPALDERDNANPWGLLAKTWSQFDKARQPRPPSPIIERILPMPSRMTPPPSPPVFSSSRVKLVARRRERPPVRRSEPESSDNEDWFSRSKMPRMRMHADDEEKKLEKRLKKLQRRRAYSNSPPRRKNLRKKIVPQKPESNSEETSATSEAEPSDKEEEVPDLRVAVPADESPEPEEDVKPDVQQGLFLSGNAKSVLRGARGGSDNEEDEEEDNEDSDETEVVQSRRHRSRSKEKRKHHRKHRKESSHHKSKRRNSDTDSPENTGKIKSTIRRKSPEVIERTSQRVERRRSHERERRSSKHRRRREEDRRDHGDRKSDNRERRKHGSESRSGRDLRSKIGHRHKEYDSNNEFRSKSPLQIEIDNDEYYRRVESD